VEMLEYSYKPNIQKMIVFMAVSVGMSAFLASQATTGRGLIIQHVIHLSPKATAIFYLVTAGLLALGVPFSIFEIVVSQKRKNCIRLTESEISFHRANRSHPDSVVRFADINKVNSEVRSTLLTNQRFIQIHHSGGKLIIDQSHLPSPSAYESLYESIINRLQLMQLNPASSG
jgi:hypothetical protein